MASTGRVWTVLGSGGQLWSRISSLNELLHFKGELRYPGLVYEVIACKALWEEIGQITSKLAYSGPVFVTVSRYDWLVWYLTLHYLFWAVLALYVMFDRITINEPRKCECDKKWTIIIQNDLSWRGVTNFGHIWHSIAHSGQFWTSASKKATYDSWRQLVAYTSLYGFYWSRMTYCRQWWPNMVKKINFERVCTLQGRIEGPRSCISGYSMYGNMKQDWSS